jgi:hypothetical protein
MANSLGNPEFLQFALIDCLLPKHPNQNAVEVPYPKSYNKKFRFSLFA